jgi:hypothetical protein
MALFDEVFNKVNIYEMLFFNVKGVLIHPTLADLKVNDEPMYKQWLKISETKYNLSNEDEDMLYLKMAVNHHEYCKIVAITYATLYQEDGQLKREFKKIANLNEALVIETFMTELTILSSEAVKSTPQFFPPLCGHNIINYDIPLLFKRFAVLRDKFISINQVPLILKRSLSIKPWESGLIDVVNVWKFNGFENSPLMLIADYLGLKRTVDLLPKAELSAYYWDNIDENEKKTLDFVSLQSATQTNFVIQLMNEFRQF